MQELVERRVLGADGLEIFADRPVDTAAIGIAAKTLLKGLGVFRNLFQPLLHDASVGVHRVRFRYHVAYCRRQIRPVEAAIPSQPLAKGDVEQAWRVSKIFDARISRRQWLAVAPAFRRVVTGRASITCIARQPTVEEQLETKLRASLIHFWGVRKRGEGQGGWRGHLLHQSL